MFCSAPVDWGARTASACSSPNGRAFFAYVRELVQSGALGKIMRFTGTHDQDQLLDESLPITWRHINKLAGCGALSLTFFLFHRARRIFFLMSQKENGGCVPAAVRRVPLRSKENVRNIPMGKAHLGLQFRMVSPCSLVPHSGTFPSQFINQFMVNQKERSSWQSI